MVQSVPEGFVLLSVICDCSANGVAALYFCLYLQYINFTNYELCSLREFVWEVDCAFHFGEDMP